MHYTQARLAMVGRFRRPDLAGSPSSTTMKNEFALGPDATSGGIPSQQIMLDGSNASREPT